MLWKRSRYGSSPSPVASQRPLIVTEQRTTQNAEDIDELKTSLFDLATMLLDRLRNTESWLPTLRQRVQDLSRLLQLFFFHIGSDKV
jgi:hypothetical protein